MENVGYRTGRSADTSRQNWEGTGPRPVPWSAWYPASPVAGRPILGTLFNIGEVHPDAPLADQETFPVVLLSHGTGGAAESLGWLAHRLATEGYVVIAANHHGNTGSEPYRAEGFLCWWERATDLSFLLSALSKSGCFAGRLDEGQVHAVGFSLGAHTAFALAGARTSMARYLDWAAATGFGHDGPREFPGVGAMVPQLVGDSPVFRASWDRQGDDFSDPRIRSFTAIAPPPPVRGFDPQSLRSIERPVLILTGEADEEAPSGRCADWLQQQNPRFQRVSLGEEVGHYTFLGLPVGPVTEDSRFLFEDTPTVDRRAVHAATARLLKSHLSTAFG